MDVNQCLEKGLLRKDTPDLEKARNSITTAEHKLENAGKAIDAGLFEDAIVNAYTAMFHAARALLFKDGFKERSHYAVYVYLREKYKDQLEPRFINELNNLRMERHELMYGLKPPTENKTLEAEEIIPIAGEFIEAVEKLIQ